MSENEERKWRGYPQVTTTTIRVIDGRRVLSRSELIEKWGVDARTISRYIEAGMPMWSESRPHFQIFFLDEVEKWRDINIERKGPKATVPRVNEALPEEESHQGRKVKADADKAVEDAMIAQLKRKQLEGSLIDSETLDLAQAEQAVIYQTLYVNDKKILPVQLESKTASEIRQFLDIHYANRMSDLDKFVNKKWPEGTKHLSDMIYAWFRSAVDA